MHMNTILVLNFVYKQDSFYLGPPPQSYYCMYVKILIQQWSADSYCHVTIILYVVVYCK